MRAPAFRLRARAAAVTTVAALLAGAATAQYASDPFFDQTVVQSRGFGLEMMGVRLHLLDAYGVAPEGLEETVEGFEEDLVRFGGTLVAEAPDVAGALGAALEELEEAFEGGDDLGSPIRGAREALDAAYAAVVPADVRATAAYRAGVAADLLLAEGGVAARVEEAVEGDDPWMYPLGWAALQRVVELWNGLAELATPEQDSFAQQYLDMLHGIYPSPTVPDVLPSNPEEAESPAQSLVGILESVADAALYPGRDVRRLAPHLATVTAPACEAYATGDDALAFERIVIVGDLYDAHLADFLGMVASDADDAVTGRLAALGYGGGDGDDDDDAEEGGEDAELAELADDPSAVCQQLLEALEEANAVLGG